MSIPCVNEDVSDEQGNGTSKCNQGKWIQSRQKQFTKTRNNMTQAGNKRGHIFTQLDLVWHKAKCGEVEELKIADGEKNVL